MMKFLIILYLFLLVFHFFLVGKLEKMKLRAETQFLTILKLASKERSRKQGGKTHAGDESSAAAGGAETSGEAAGQVSGACGDRSDDRMPDIGDTGAPEA